MRSSLGAALFAAALFWASPLTAQQAQTPTPVPSQAASGQAPKPAHSRKTSVSPTNPDLDPDDQLAPSQMKQAAPAAAGPASAPAKPAQPATRTAEAPHPPARAIPPSARVVACGGIFGKDSSHLRLAMTYDSKNISFAEIEAIGGTKVQASVLFPNDPARRLEVWWANPAARTGTYLIVIGGKSTWTGPGGMKLGLTIAQLEKLNHKPFKLKGFDKSGVATVSDWDGGALADLPGGCKSGLSLRADPKTAPDALAEMPADKEFISTDATIRAVKPTVSEVLIGY